MDFIITKKQAIDCLSLKNERVHSFSYSGLGLAGADMDLEDVVEMMDNIKNPAQICISNSLKAVNHVVAVFSTKYNRWYFFDSDISKVSLIIKGKPE